MGERVEIMEGELIIITIISSCFGMAGLYMVNHYWFLRQDHRLKNTKELKELEYKHKKGMRKFTVTKPNATKAGGFDLGSLAGLLGNLDDDTKLSLIDAVTNQGYSVPTESGDMISSLIKAVPNDVLKGLAEKFLSGNKTEQKEEILFEK